MTDSISDNDAALGEGLISLGLYGACFEAMVLAFRSKTQEWLLEYEPGRLEAFGAACKTAHRTFEFCGPLLVRMGVLQESEYDSLSEIRERRNELTHDAFDHVVTLRLDHLREDLDQMDRITARVVNWRFDAGPHSTRRAIAVGDSVPFTVNARVVTYLFRELAEDLVLRRFRQPQAESLQDPERAV